MQMVTISIEIIGHLRVENAHGHDVEIYHDDVKPLLTDIVNVCTCESHDGETVVAASATGVQYEQTETRGA